MVGVDKDRVEKVLLDVPVVFSVDNSYFPYFINACSSLLSFNKVDRIYLLTDFAVSNRQVRKINEKIEKPFSVEVKIVDVSAWLKGKDFFTSDHISVATYFRLFIPEVLPRHEDRVIFLHSDILILGGLKDLEIPKNSDKLCIAVRHGFDREDVDHLRSEGIEALDYFNAGVLGLHLDYIRREGVFRAALDVLKKGQKFKYWDQDILNIFLNRRVHFVSDKFNYFSTKSPRDVKVVHFIGSMKPWHVMSRHPFRALYLSFVIKNRLELPLREFLMFNKIQKKIKNFFR